LLRDQYNVTPLTAGYLTAAVALVGSGIRPIGGYLADRFGGVRVLLQLLVSIVATYAVIAMLPALGAMSILLVIGMACLGMGNGAVFQLVPQRFRADIGIATGVVGAVGGLGGFMLPTLLGYAKQSTGSFGPGFVVLAFVAFGAASLLQALFALRSGWRLSWRAIAVSRAVEES
jgi:NNP family nitrate/nitrite transporter-like MFS transporter